MKSLPADHESSTTDLEKVGDESPEPEIGVTGPENKISTTLAPPVPPEEGRKGWLCVLGSSLSIFCSFGFLNAIGLFQVHYQETTLKNYTPSTISWIFAVQVALMWAPGPLYGRLLDTYGPAPVIYPCSFLCVFALCMTSLSDQYYQIFLAQGICFGIGAGGCFTASLVCVGQWFVKRRGFGVGIAASASGLGGVIFPIFFNKVEGKVGFNGSLRYTALFIGILLACSCFLISSRLPPKKWDHNTKWIDFKLFKEKQIACYCLGSYFCMWGLWAPFDYITSMAQATGFSSSLSLYLISILNASSIFGRVIPPYLADRIGHFNVLTASALLSGASILCLWLPFNYHHSHAGVIIFALVYGFVSGSYVSLLVPCIAKAGSIETIGQRFGTCQIVIAVACLTGLPIMGQILNVQGDTNFSGLQIFSGVCLLIGTALTGLATLFIGRVNKTWRI